MELHLDIGFSSGSMFPDADGIACPVHDTVELTWQHLNFFEHNSYLHCAVPRIKTPDGNVETVSVPWARSGSGFTLLFEAFAMTFDRFHVVKLLNEAMDKVRRVEHKEHAELKGEKYTFLKNQQNLSDKKKNKLAEMIILYPKLGEAYRLKMLFNDLWEMPDKSAATAFLTQWCKEVDEAKIPAFMDFSKTVRAHWSGIIHFVESRISNGILEGINSKVQLAKRRARGYRNINNFINMIYFLCGKLKFDYPLYFT